MALGCAHEEYLENISILLDEDNDLEEEIIDLFNEISISIFKFVKKHNHSGSKYTQIMYRNTGQLQTKQSMFSSIATVWFGLEAQFSQLIKSE